MTINSYLDSKEIKIKEVEEYFILEKRLEVNDNYDQCHNCGEKINAHKYRSQPWTGCRYCVNCKRLNLTIYCDRMGGGLSDTVLIFKEK